MEPTEYKDFFISYVDSDKSWAEWIAWQLEAAGYTTIFRDWDFRAGGNTIVDTNQATIRATRTIAVFSPDYLTSPDASAEWTVAVKHDPTGELGLFVPVRVQLCNPEGLLGTRTYIDLVDLDDATAKRTLLAQISRQRKKPTSIPSIPSHPSFPGPSTSLFPTSNIPYARNTFTVGRKEVLSSLHTKFQTGESNIQAISGLGGIGKTHIALKYVDQFYKEYNTILWLTADSQDTLQKDTLEIAQLLDLLPPEILSPETPLQLSQDQPGKIRARREKAPEDVDPLSLVKDWLGDHSQWLVIIDNIEESKLLKAILPSSARRQGHVLLTTRQTALENIVPTENIIPIPIPELTPDDGATILLKHAEISIDNQTEQAKQENRNSAKLLSEMMDGLPLALDQAGAYIQQTQISIKEYIALYTNRARRIKFDLLNRADLLKEEHPQSVVTTFTLSFEKIKSLNLTNAQILQICAFIYPDAIPEKIITDAFNSLSPTEQPIEAEETASAVQPLLHYSLLHRNWGNETYTIHRILQTVLQDNILAQQQPIWIEKTIALLNALPVSLDEEMVNRKSQKRSLTQSYITHAQMCATHIKTWQIQSAAAVELLNRAGAYTYQQRRYSQAQEFYEGLLRIKKPVEGTGNLDRARTLGILANLTYLQKDKNQYKEAAKKYEEALGIYKDLLPPNDPYIGQMLQQYAMLLRRWKRWKEAEEAASQERQIWKSMSSQEKTRFPWGWIGLDLSSLGDLEIGRYNLLGNLLVFWGLEYCLLIGIPIVCAFLFHSSWWGWGISILLLFGLLATISDKVTKNPDQLGVKIGGISFLAVSIIVGVAGWQVGKILLTLWHLTSWSGPLQITFLIGSAFLIWAIATFGLLVILFYIDSQNVIPEYTLLPTFTFTVSLFGLPIISSLLLHSWSIAITVFLATWIWASIHYFLISWGRTFPYQRTLASFVFACAWAALGWIIATSLNTHLPAHNWLPFLLTFVGFTLGLYCHIVTYRLLNGIGTEGNILLVLEDLWINFETVILLKINSSTPIKYWQNFYFCLALGLQTAQQYPESIANCTTLILSYGPKEPLYYVTRGNTYYCQHDYTHALADYQQAIALDPHYSSAYEGWANLCADQGDYPSAFTHFDKAISLNPKHASTYFFRAYAHYAQHNLDQALSDFDRAILLNPKYTLAYNGRGNTLFAQGDYPNAIIAYDNAISLHPKFTSAYSARGTSYFRQEQYSLALNDFNRVLWLDPHNSSAYYQSAEVYLAQHDYPHTISDCTQAIALDPKNVLFYRTRSYAYYEQSDYPDALEDLNKVILLDPKDIDSYFGRSSIYSDQGEYLRARSDLSEIILLDPHNALAYYRRGSLYSIQHDSSRAISDFTQSISLNPNDGLSYLGRGNAYVDQGNFTQAISDFTQALFLNPTLIAAYDGRGNAYSKQGDFARAKADFDQALLLDPQNTSSPILNQDAQPEMLPTTSETEKIQDTANLAEATPLQNASTIDGDAILKSIKHKDIPPSWQLYTENELGTFILGTVIGFMLPAALLIGVITVIIALLHLPWHTWLLWLSVSALTLWILFVTPLVLLARGTRLVILPDGFVYRHNFAKTAISIHYASLKALTIEKNKLSLDLKNGEQQTIVLPVSTRALQNLEKSYLTFTTQEDHIFFIDEKAVLERLKRKDIPASWQVHRYRQTYPATIIIGGAFSLLVTGLCLILALGITSLFHLPWHPWLFWLLLLIPLLWSLFLTYGVIRVVIMPEGFVYRTLFSRLSLHYEQLQAMTIQGRKVTLVFKNSEKQTLDLYVSSTAPLNLQNAYQAYKTQKSSALFIDGNAVLAKTKQGAIPPTWQIYTNPNVPLQIASGGFYSALFLVLCLGMALFIATFTHLLWQSWLPWVSLSALILEGLLTAIFGIHYKRIKLVIMPEGFVYRDFLDKEPDLSLHYQTIKEMHIQGKKITLIFKNHQQKTTSLDVSEEAIQHLQNTYMAFNAQDASTK